MSSSVLPTLPAQPANVPFPTQEWPLAKPKAGTDTAKLDALLDHAFGAKETEELGETHALLVIQNGAIVTERYAEGLSAQDTFPSWSMAKSNTHALTGILTREGKIDVNAPAYAPEWQGKDDPRKAITLDQLMRMSSGLAFQEDYNPEHPSDVIEMLWGTGKDDVAHFAANFPLAHEPNSTWYYSSGTSNIVSRAVANGLGSTTPEEFEAFMRTELFDRIGMKNVDPKFDTSGTFIGSSFCFSRARDFARFGLLYLRDGVWDGKRILPENWVDYARTPTAQTVKQLEEEGGYGAHFWLGFGGPDTFSCNGFEGQYIVMVPELDLILVRHGRTPTEKKTNTIAFMKDVIGCFQR